MAEQGRRPPCPRCADTGEIANPLTGLRACECPAGSRIRARWEAEDAARIGGWVTVECRCGETFERDIEVSPQTPTAMRVRCPQCSREHWITATMARY